MQSNTETLPSFDSMADVFVSLGALGSPAELHGMACGRLCGGGRYSDREWLRSALEFLDVSTEPGPDAEATLTRVYHSTLDQLQDDELGMQLLLPGDDVEMAQRIMALSQWCQGFLTGFGTSGISAETPLSGDTADTLRDFASFVQISPDTGDDDDSETDYMEIVEYVRLATLSIFLEFGVDNAGESDDSPTVH
ncbi:UPF0149 family protein [Gilvimarinus sp. F26214L]|uniref:UPF0149 family protein n=1 Tax=Gilvimarinus sp. DZF01 TaxID=3461371 RepID=UPI0040464CB5